MAAQGKACREDTFDVATARNGFSGIRSQQALGLCEEKVGEGLGCLVPKEPQKNGLTSVIATNGAVTPYFFAWSRGSP